MSQSKRASAIETVANVAIGYVVAIATQLVVFPMFGIHENFGRQLGIGSLFTVISIVRSYLLRRMFNSFRGKLS